ncbi:MAG: hypothetical protein JNN15_01100 [Blastocatellia bacterium]|nr:hypothetical protein [Blastocatellia bacterium]
MKVCPSCGFNITGGESKNSNLLIIAVAGFALFAAGVIVLFSYLALSSNSEPENNTPQVEAKTPNNQPDEKKVADQPSTDELQRYSSLLQPAIAQIFTEMETTANDLQQFLKDVNQAKNKNETKTTVDLFQQQMRSHSKQFATLRDSLNAIYAPAKLYLLHKKLISSVEKYERGTEGYVQGLAQYSFAQIQLSQAELETSDKEIRSSAEELRKSIYSLQQTPVTDQKPNTK